MQVAGWAMPRPMLESGQLRKRMTFTTVAYDAALNDAQEIAFWEGMPLAGG